MEKYIKALRSWMIKYKFSMNDSKTELIIIGTRQQLAKVSIDCLSAGDTSSTPAVDAVKKLGSWFDENMSMVTHTVCHL